MARLKTSSEAGDGRRVVLVVVGLKKANADNVWLWGTLDVDGWAGRKHHSPHYGTQRLRVNDYLCSLSMVARDPKERRWDKDGCSKKGQRAGVELDCAKLITGGLNTSLT